ncbi:MAG: 4Fe-4S binding protein [Bacteroidales bacterium]|jgi:MinD superfamily P-loop ATPase|nr:4Fe-4S binding protein [Bacteroidales bacterium]MCB9029233.1 4Fe-4S binding protein [Bacteroidales bacterium]MDD3737164.1 ATP-binding protein [Bacteroidales bacterium]HNT94474.1 ATP-binding protein [Bacteroidales bacterium]HOO67564.1 ATP-binding protein [Bacteroidales bacterium]
MELAVVSGKGGTGKSSVTAAFATAGERIVVADCDVDAANLYLLFNPEHDTEQVYIGGYTAVVDHALCTVCGICESYCRFDAITEVDGKIMISETSCDGCFFCSRICPMDAITMVRSDRSRMYSGSFRNGKMVYGRLAPGEENSGKLVSLVREEAKRVATAQGMSTILLDGPPGIGCPVISTVTGVDRIIIVTEPTMSGLEDMKRVHEVARKFTGDVGIIINKYDLNEAMADRIEGWCVAQGSALLGRLPYDRRVTEAMISGKSVTEMFPEAEISIILNEIWNKMTTNGKE